MESRSIAWWPLHRGDGSRQKTLLVKWILASEIYRDYSQSFPIASVVSGLTVLVGKYAISVQNPTVPSDLKVPLM